MIAMGQGSPSRRHRFIRWIPSTGTSSHRMWNQGHGAGTGRPTEPNKSFVASLSALLQRRSVRITFAVRGGSRRKTTWEKTSALREQHCS